jgi:predicted Zn-dependent protease
MKTTPNRSAFVALGVLLTLTSMPALAQRQNADIENIGTRNINSGSNGLTPDLEAEIEIGRGAAASLEQWTPLIQDMDVRNYVNRVGQNIVSNSDAKVPFTIEVIDSDAIDALALPGGFLYVTKGLILAADNEAELAGLFAHHVAHVAARHAMEGQGRINLLNVANVPPSIFSGGIPAAIVRDALAIGVPISFLAFSRAAEEEADWLGLQYMIRAGYDPSAMLRFFERLQVQQDLTARLSRLFATHPLPADRVRMAQEHIQNFSAITSEFQRIKSRLN